MKPPPFTYVRPDSLDDAIGQLGPETTLLAGGQSLIPMLNLRMARPATIVDISRLEELRAVASNGDSLSIGAMVTHASIETYPWPVGMNVLATAASQIGYPAIRHRGTIGGSLSHADPAAELPTTMVALDAVMSLQSSAGTRSVPAGLFFTGYYSTARNEDEILTSVTFPTRADLRTGFAELSRRVGDFAIALAAVSCWTERDETQARVVVGGMDTHPKRIEKIEVALKDGHDWQEVCTPEVLSSFTDPSGDIHGSADYRLHVGAEMVRRAIGRMEEHSR